MRIVLASAAIAGLLAGSEAPRAQGMPDTIGGIICDTMEQLRAFVAASQSGRESLRETYRQYNDARNARNESVCVVGQVPHDLVSVPNSIDLGPWPENGFTYTAYGLRLGRDENERWFLYVSSRKTGGI